MSRLSSILVLVLICAWQPTVAEDLPLIKVYKTPTCGCCSKWIDHLQANGFQVEWTNMDSVGVIKAEKGVPSQLASCHTAVVEGYVIEGHVPAEDIFKLLREKPEIIGIAVPQMPVGSPGMEGPNPSAYRVYSFDSNGDTEEFAVHTP
jgi:hypothetical protein